MPKKNTSISVYLSQCLFYLNKYLSLEFIKKLYSAIKGFFNLFIVTPLKHWAKGLSPDSKLVFVFFSLPLKLFEFFRTKNKNVLIHVGFVNDLIQTGFSLISILGVFGVALGIVLVIFPLVGSVLAFVWSAFNLCFYVLSKSNKENTYFKSKLGMGIDLGFSTLSLIIASISLLSPPLAFAMGIALGILTAVYAFYKLFKFFKREPIVNIVKYKKSGAGIEDKVATELPNDKELNFSRVGKNSSVYWKKGTDSTEGTVTFQTQVVGISFFAFSNFKPIADNCKKLTETIRGHIGEKTSEAIAKIQHDEETLYKELLCNWIKIISGWKNENETEKLKYAKMLILALLLLGENLEFNSVLNLPEKTDALKKIASNPTDFFSLIEKKLNHYFEPLDKKNENLLFSLQMAEFKNYLKEKVDLTSKNTVDLTAFEGINFSNIPAILHAFEKYTATIPNYAYRSFLKNVGTFQEAANAGKDYMKLHHEVNDFLNNNDEKPMVHDVVLNSENEASKPALAA